ncbi:glycosyltransferase family 4 protein [Rhodocytophaga aerolata]|uniref:Glycosyltransferase family 4 protein n=1 Tax=Rhodocytophaga aerolata TaxID=455078 RepID=A0ABT8RBY4_9BACT|nr:glycosyltransferase family 4 protein [Rhodocytophaga aerolata]MDO1448839.1 glycosyltransferase family 4 protein [Rhodocytophaga aerolata]
MNILFSIGTLDVGGAQTIALRLASEFAAKQNYNVYFYNVASEKIESEMVEAILTSQVKFLSIYNYPIINFLLWKVNGILKLAGISYNFREKAKEWYFKFCIKRYKINLISSHLIGSDLFCTRILKKSAIPIVITEHGDYVVHKKLGVEYLEPQMQGIFSRANFIVTVSDYCKKNIIEFMNTDTKPVQTIYNGITIVKQQYYGEARRKLGISEKAIVYGLVARGIEEKGWREAIEAFLWVQSNTGKELHLVLVGAGEFLDKLKQIYTQYTSSIHFVGYSNKPAFWIESFDVGLLPTYFETLSNTVIEYIFMEKPAIVSNTGGVPEVVCNNGEVAGVLIDLDKDGKPCIKQLADAMLKYVTSTNLIKKHSVIAKKAFKKFEIDSCVQQYEKLFIYLTKNQ